MSLYPEVHQPKLPICLLCLVSLTLFAPALNYGFVSLDDDIHVYENPLLKAPLVPALARAWSTPFLSLYIPATYSVWLVANAAEKKILPGKDVPDPRLFHALSVLAHAASVVLVFLLVQSLVEAPWAAFLGALLFAVHPLQVEPVAWVSGFRDVFSAMLALLAMQQWVVFLRRTEDAARETRLAPYILGLLALLLSLLAKPGAVVVPLLACLLAWMNGKLSRVRLWLLPWFAAVLPFALVTIHAQAPHFNFTPPVISARLFVAADALAFYLRKLAWPFSLGIDYGRTPARVLGERGIAWVWCLPAGVAALCALGKDRRGWLTSFGIFAIALLPVMGFVPFVFQEFSTVADRYAYLPLMGASLALALALRRIPWKGIGYAALLLLFGAALLSGRQLGTWRNNLTLYTNATKVNPETWGGHLNLGLEYEKMAQWDGAIREYEAALRIEPDNPGTYFGLARLLVKGGKLDRAVALFPTANRYPRNERYNLEISYFRKRRQADFSRAVAFEALGNILLAQSLYDEAARLFDASLALSPKSATYVSKGFAVLGLGRKEEAKKSWNQALELDPRSDVARKALASYP